MMGFIVIFQDALIFKVESHSKKDDSVLDTSCLACQITARANNAIYACSYNYKEASVFFYSFSLNAELLSFQKVCRTYSAWQKYPPHVVFTIGFNSKRVMQKPLLWCT